SLAPDMQTALARAVANWHKATREYEQIADVFADAQRQLEAAKRDLHELARAMEVVTGTPAAELVTNQPTPHGAVTMPIAPVPNGTTIGAAADNVDAAQIVLEEMMKMRTGGM
ncbi:MAG: hypothetical protein AB7Q76_21260, partial [Gammaproteobacteria bacterium]